MPPPNSYELYQALKDRGIPVKLVFYKGFGHAINKPKQQRSLLEQNYEWFSKYIWDEQPMAHNELSAQPVDGDWRRGLTASLRSAVAHNELSGQP